MNRTTRRIRVAAVGAAAVVTSGLAAACAPPPPPAPVLPAGVGVQWLRDTGGTLEPAGYRPAWERWSVLGGVVSGPVGGVGIGVLPPTAWATLGGLAPLVPDGTARFPWNGFAGEGVTDVTSPNGLWTDHTVSGPAGTCTFTSSASETIMGIVPSVDGTRVAVVDRVADWIGGPGPTKVRVVALAPGCATLARADHSTSTGSRIISPAVVWSPDGSAIAYALRTNDAAGQVAVLDAVAGATPRVVADAGTAPGGTSVLPLGWSVADRLLVTTAAPAGDGTSTTTTLETLDLATGGRARFDSLTSGSSIFAALHFGYFIPGTTTVVYDDAGETRVNEVGKVVPWFRVRLYDDTTGGKGRLLATDPPFGWHTEGIGQVPNAEMVERFVR